MLISMGTQAQNVTVYNSDGSVVNYPSDSVDYVDFSRVAATNDADTAPITLAGKKWARWNLGAGKEHYYDFGWYTAWGEDYSFVDGNGDFDNPNDPAPSNRQSTQYSFVNLVLTSGMPNQLPGNGLVDVATVRWGGTWRLPTRQDFEDLFEKCYWAFDDTQVTSKGIPSPGYWVGSSKADTELAVNDRLKKCIFLPCAGMASNNSGDLNSSSIASNPYVGVGTQSYAMTSLIDRGTRGYYWTKTRGNESNHQYANAMGFVHYPNVDADNERWRFVDAILVSAGLTLRPVKD